MAKVAKAALELKKEIGKHLNEYIKDRNVVSSEYTPVIIQSICHTGSVRSYQFNVIFKGKAPDPFVWEDLVAYLKSKLTTITPEIWFGVHYNPNSGKCYKDWDHSARNIYKWKPGDPILPFQDIYSLNLDVKYEPVFI